MNANLVSAVFDSQTEAERAVTTIRNAGIADSAISIIAQHDGKNMTTDGSGAEAATDIVGKAALGAGAGTLLGIAALAIPGVGPLVAAGAIAAAAIPGAALTGAAIGAAAGGLAGLLTDHGVDGEDANYYESRINDGGVFVSVDTQETGMDAHTVREMLTSAGGRAKNSESMTSAY